jgi:MFS family permease
VPSAEATAPRALDSLPLRALLAAEIISTTGSQMTWLALPWFVHVTTGSAAQMSVVAAAEVGAYALFGIPSGTVLARLGARRTMLVCDAVRAPLMLTIPVLHHAGALTLGVLVVVAFLLGLFSTPYAAAQRVVLPELLGEDQALVGQANALFQGATRLTLLAGPPLAGILIGAIGASGSSSRDGRDATRPETTRPRPAGSSQAFATSSATGCSLRGPPPSRSATAPSA